MQKMVENFASSLTPEADKLKHLCLEALIDLTGLLRFSNAGVKYLSNVDVYYTMEI